MKRKSRTFEQNNFRVADCLESNTRFKAHGGFKINSVLIFSWYSTSKNRDWSKVYVPPAPNDYKNFPTVRTNTTLSGKTDAHATRGKLIWFTTNIQWLTTYTKLYRYHLHWQHTRWATTAGYIYQIHPQAQNPWLYIWLNGTCKHRQL